MAKSSSAAKSGRERTRAYRERLRTMGLKPVQVWLPDRGSEEFKARIRREAEMIAQSAAEREYVKGLAADADELDWPYTE